MIVPYTGIIKMDYALSQLGCIFVVDTLISIL